MADKFRLWDLFGQDVRGLLWIATVDYVDQAIAHQFADPVPLDIYMLGAFMKLGVTCHCYWPVIVSQDMASRAPSDIATYSTSVNDREIVVCFFDPHLITPPLPLEARNQEMIYKEYLLKWAIKWHVRVQSPILCYGSVFLEYSLYLVLWLPR